MRFVIITIISALSSALMVQAVNKKSSPAESAKKLENPSVLKFIKVTCKTEDQAINCKSNLKTVESKNQGGFRDAKFNPAGRRNEVEGYFHGGCTNVDEALGNVTSCGVADCPTVLCGIPLNYRINPNERVTIQRSNLSKKEKATV